jgi:hypothetical protein
MLSQTAGAPIEAVVIEGDDAFAGVVDAVRSGAYDEIMISLLSDSDSRWALEDLPGRAEALGIPVTVVRADAVST